MLLFNECTLVKLDKIFGLKQIATASLLEDWLNAKAEITDIEHVFRTGSFQLFYQEGMGEYFAKYPIFCSTKRSVHNRIHMYNM